MQIVITGKHLEVTDAMRNYIDKKIGKLEKYFRREDDWANVVLGMERGQFFTEVSIGGSGTIIYASACTPDMYASIDEVVEKLKKQIKKFKEKLKTEKQRRARLAIAEKKMSYASSESDLPEADEEIVRRKIPLEKPMSLEEARMQLDLSGNIFLVFYSSENHSVNVIYKMKDGRYGVFMS